MSEFVSDGCTGIPDLWMEACCVAHDYADFTGVPDVLADTQFLQCLTSANAFLGALGALLAYATVKGMQGLRPAWRWYKSRFKR